MNKFVIAMVVGLASGTFSTVQAFGHRGCHGCSGGYGCHGYYGGCHGGWGCHGGYAWGCMGYSCHGGIGPGYAYGGMPGYYYSYIPAYYAAPTVYGPFVTTYPSAGYYIGPAVPPALATGIESNGTRQPITSTNNGVIQQTGFTTNGSDRAPATLIVNLPADARLTIDGMPTQLTSSRRVFVSPPLDRNQEYYYTLRAEMTQPDGKTLTATQRVNVKGGEEKPVLIEFNGTGTFERLDTPPPPREVPR